jgi:hypothetical protein
VSSLDGRRAAALGWRSALTRLLAVTILVGAVASCVLLVVEVVHGQLGGDGLLVDHTSSIDRLRATQWSDAEVSSVAALVGITGLAAFVLAAWPRRPEALAVRRDGAHVVAVRRHDAERSVGAAVATSTGHDVSATLRRRRVRLRLRPAVGRPVDRRAVQVIGEQAVAELGFHDMKVKVTT